MTFRRALMAACLLAAPAAPLRAQRCDNAPPSPHAVLNQKTIQAAALRARHLLGTEGLQTGATQAATRTQRLQLFRAISRDHWRWVCDRRANLAQDLPGRADLLIQGMVFFDLANDVQPLQDWYMAAKTDILSLNQRRLPLPAYWGRPAEAYLKTVRDRLGLGRRYAEQWYFEIGKQG